MHLGALLRPAYAEPDKSKRAAIHADIANGPWKVCTNDRIEIINSILNIMYVFHDLDIVLRSMGYYPVLLMRCFPSPLGLV